MYNLQQRMNNNMYLIKQGSKHILHGSADNAHDDAKIAGLVEGFFVGAFDFHGMTDIGHCISDANPVEQHFENAMRGFWNGSYQEATKAID